MPFAGPAGVGDAVVKLQQVAPKDFVLLEGFRYTSASGVAYEVQPTALGSTDLASIPYVFRWFVHSYGRHTLPALLHDCLVRGACASATAAPVPSRVEADDLFLEAMAAEVSAVGTTTLHLVGGELPHAILILGSARTGTPRPLDRPRARRCAHLHRRCLPHRDGPHHRESWYRLRGRRGARSWAHCCGGPATGQGCGSDTRSSRSCQRRRSSSPRTTSYKLVERIAQAFGGPAPPSRRHF